jgi:hypothetical protein
MSINRVNRSARSGFLRVLSVFGARPVTRGVEPVEKVPEQILG